MTESLRDLSIELKREKVLQHVIVFAQYMAREVGSGADAGEILAEAAARCYRVTRPAGVTPDEWVAEGFAQYMRELVLDGAPA